MPEIWLIRHAPTAWTGSRYCGRSDPPLSDAGTEIADRLTMALQVAVPQDVTVISSPLRRAVQTAHRLARVLSRRPIEMDARWAETDFGAAERMTFDELSAAMPDIAARLLVADFDIDWPGGEPAWTLRARVEAAWNDLVGRSRPVLVVSHAGPLRIAMGLASNPGQPAVTTLDAAGVWRPRAMTAEATAGATIPR